MKSIYTNRLLSLSSACLVVMLAIGISCSSEDESGDDDAPGDNASSAQHDAGAAPDTESLQPVDVSDESEEFDAADAHDPSVDAEGDDVDAQPPGEVCDENDAMRLNEDTPWTFPTECIIDHCCEESTACARSEACMARLACHYECHVIGGNQGTFCFDDCNEEHPDGSSLLFDFGSRCMLNTDIDHDDLTCRLPGVAAENDDTIQIEIGGESMPVNAEEVVESAGSLRISFYSGTFAGQGNAVHINLDATALNEGDVYGCSDDATVTIQWVPEGLSPFIADIHRGSCTFELTEWDDEAVAAEIDGVLEDETDPEFSQTIDAQFEVLR